MQKGAATAKGSVRGDGEDLVFGKTKGQWGFIILALVALAAIVFWR